MVSARQMRRAPAIVRCADRSFGGESAVASERVTNQISALDELRKLYAWPAGRHAPNHAGIVRIGIPVDRAISPRLRHLFEPSDCSPRRERHPCRTALWLDT